MIERRTFKLLELRAKKGDNAPGGIAGHAAVFNSLSEDLGGFKEMIRPGAFASSIAKDDVRALWNHDVNFPLGRNKNNTLRLQEDDIGLAVDIDLPATTYARDLFESIDRGDIDQMSFGFSTLRDDWRFEGGNLIVRELIEVKLYDVSPVTFPAYPQTDIDTRALFAEKIKELGGSRPAPTAESQMYRLKILRRRLDLAAR